LSSDSRWIDDLQGIWVEQIALQALPGVSASMRHEMLRLDDTKSNRLNIQREHVKLPDVD
jgi:hypothetical protein